MSYLYSEYSSSEDFRPLRTGDWDRVTELQDLIISENTVLNAEDGRKSTNNLILMIMSPF